MAIVLSQQFALNSPLHTGCDCNIMKDCKHEPHCETTCTNESANTSKPPNSACHLCRTHLRYIRLARITTGTAAAKQIPAIIPPGKYTLT